MFRRPRRPPLFRRLLLGLGLAAALALAFLPEQRQPVVASLPPEPAVLPPSSPEALAPVAMPEPEPERAAAEAPPPAGTPLPQAKPRPPGPPRTLIALARSGNGEAQLQLAAAYSDLRDEPRAAEWMREAAISGLPEARYRLAQRYRDGRGVAADPIEAFIWFRTAGEQGHAAAQRAVGESYERGLGVPASAVEAFAWYALAAENGDEEAAGRRAALEGRLLAAERKLAEARVQSLTATSAPNRNLVAEIQRLLRSRGIDAGVDDGFFGERTAEAIRRFQEEDGLPVDGRPSEALVVRLRTGLKPPPPPVAD
jgi:localization factor PodJL